MLYTTRLADDPNQAHVNYDCPCGCVAGLMYHKQTGSMHLGACCCGRLLWLGDDAEATVQQNFEAGVIYSIDSNLVTLPWGDEVTAAMAIPIGSLTPAPSSQADNEGAPAANHDEGSEQVQPATSPQRVRDLVCGMMIRPEFAAATSVYNGETYYFCAVACKQSFDANPARYLTS